MIISPLVPGLLTDGLFGGDGKMVGVSLAITLVGAAALTTICFLLAYLNRNVISGGPRGTVPA
jgi:hypothetical protein